METWITAHAALTFALMAIAGSVLHWAKKAYRGECTWNPIDYWFADNRLNSAGAAGALAVAIWGIVTSDSLAGMQWHMIVAGGFTLGWALDSGINKAGPAPAQSGYGNSQSGYARIALAVALWLATIGLLAALAGCGAGVFKTEPIAPIAVPSNLSEAGKQAQNLINEANAGLAAAATVIGDNVQAGVMTPAEGRDYLARVKSWAAEVDRAQSLLDAGSDVAARDKAQLVGSLIVALQKEVAARARKESQ